VFRLQVHFCSCLARSEKGPLRDTADVKFPVFGRSATFSAKLKSIVRTDRPRQDIDDPFPFPWDGKDMARGDALKDFSVSRLAEGITVAVETNIFTYDTLCPLVRDKDSSSRFLRSSTFLLQTNANISIDIPQCSFLSIIPITAKPSTL
jgi:hypothetical protein